MYERMFSEDKTTNDHVETAVDDLSVQVGTGSDEELFLVEVQHMRYVVSIPVPLQSHVICYKE